ncbi:MAG: response regulator transcription factor [Cytophagales bacterium]|nr:response regulator transcription factor [Cytophagales bacterium]
MTLPQNVRVLIVDDHQIIRDGIKALLNKVDGIRIKAEASNGFQALEILDKHHESLDLVVMDIKMPAMDGIEATHQVRKKFPGVKVLALTMHDDEAHVIKMLQEGAAGYVLKTTGKAELAEAIQKVAQGETYFDKQASEKILQFFSKEGAPKEKKEFVDPCLTSREIEVLKLIAEEYTNPEIAEKLYLSPRTVDTHRRNLLQKLQAKNTAGLVKYALRHDLV